jgi:phage/plasmid-associated DNA primase
MEEDADAGLLERLLVVPWDRHFEEHEREKNLHLEMFEKEGAGILNWLLEGLTDYFAHGLMTPPEVQQATNDARVQLSEMSKFAHDCVETVADENAIIEVRPMFERWQAWHETRGRMQVQNAVRKTMPEPWTFDKFCKELRKLRKTTETTVDGKTRTIYRGGKLRGDWKARLAARDGGDVLGGPDDETW